MEKEKEGIFDMRNYVLSCCSTADLTSEQFRSREIQYICFHFELDGKQYQDDLGNTMSFAQFYQAMREGAQTRTSQINAQEFEEYFESFLKQKKDILHICLSSGISGVINSAMIAKKILQEKYPERKIYIVDSLSASAGYGLLLDQLADLRDQGASIDELYQWVNKNKLRLQHWFFSTDLTFYIKGGRISKTAGFIGGKLQICPLLCMDAAGKLAPYSKIRTKRKVIAAMVDKMAENADHGTSYAGKYYISHSDCYEDALKLAECIEARFPNQNGTGKIYSIGTTIGSHTGPGTVALFFWGNERKEIE